MDDKTAQGRIFDDLEIVYKKMGQRDMAIKYAKKNLDIAFQAGDEREQERAYHNAECDAAGLGCLRAKQDKTRRVSLQTLGPGWRARECRGAHRCETRNAANGRPGERASIASITRRQR